MMSSGLRYVATVILFCSYVVALGLGTVPSPAHAQTTASTLKITAATKLEPTPKVLPGTLFNTQEQRERLDRARRRGGVLEDEVIDLDAVEPERSVINGFVKRSDGRDTVWVDDVMKRDPWLEVMERLEPNVVGGATRGLSKAALTNSKAQVSFFSPNAFLKDRATKKKGRGSKPFLPRRPVKK